MKEDFWEFSATHKIWLAANHKPTDKSVPEGGEEQWRRYNHCFQMLPISRFRYMRRDHGCRHATCTACAVAADRERRQGNRGRATDKWITTACDKRSAAALAAAVEEMVDRCGGMRRFVERWRQATHIAENPAIAVEAFRRVGWKVTRMSDGDSDQGKDEV